MKIKAISSGVGLRDHQKTLSKVGCMTCYPMLHSCRRKHLQTIRHCCSTHLSERVTNGHVSISKISCHWWIWNRHSSHAACSPLYTHHHSPYQFLYSKTECKEMVSRIVDPLTTLKGVRKVGLCWVHLKLLFWKSLAGCLYLHPPLPTSTSVAHRIFSSDPNCQVTQVGDAKQTLSSCLGERFSDPGVMKGEESNSVQTVLLESKHKTQSGAGIGNHSCSWHSCKFLFAEYKRKISSVQYVSM